MDKKDGGTIDLESLRGFTPGPHPDAQPTPDECFCDRMYPDSNPNASCGDCPTRDYAPQPPSIPEPSEADVSELTDEIQKAMDSLTVPHLSPSRQEYWKAGARAAIRCANYAITTYTARLRERLK